MNLKPNPNKQLIIEANGKKYARYPVKIDLVTPEDTNISEIIKKNTKNLIQEGDIVFISEKIVSISQGRSYPLKEIKPSKIATWLSQKVYKNPGGIGLRSPETMQLAIEEAGLWRILLAAAIAAITKPFGIRGLFYILAGSQARAIDGAVPYAIPPYNEYVSKGPKEPNKVAKEISQKIKCPTAIVDANDLGVNILGVSHRVNKKLIAQIIRDNPLGQTDESTPIGIIRPL